RPYATPERAPWTKIVCKGQLRQARGVLEKTGHFGEVSSDPGPRKAGQSGGGVERFRDCGTTRGGATTGTSHVTVCAGQLPLHLGVPLPDLIERRVDDELQQERGEDTADQRRRDSLHHVRAGAGGPHDREKAEKHRRDRHELRPEPPDRAPRGCLPQVRTAAQAPASSCLLS